jgi:hypothetical protein
LLLLLNLEDGQPVGSDEANSLLTLPGPVSLQVKAAKPIAFLEILCPAGPITVGRRSRMSANEERKE